MQKERKSQPKIDIMQISIVQILIFNLMGPDTWFYVCLYLIKLCVHLVIIQLTTLVQALWLTSVIQATRETGIRKIIIRDSPGQKNPQGSISTKISKLAWHVGARMWS
jgi:hypothetical protein